MSDCYPPLVTQHLVPPWPCVSIPAPILRRFGPGNMRYPQDNILPHTFSPQGTQGDIRPLLAGIDKAWCNIPR